MRFSTIHLLAILRRFKASRLSIWALSRVHALSTQKRPCIALQTPLRDVHPLQFPADITAKRKRPEAATGPEALFCMGIRTFQLPAPDFSLSGCPNKGFPISPKFLGQTPNKGFSNSVKSAAHWLFLRPRPLVLVFLGLPGLRFAGAFLGFGSS